MTLYLQINEKDEGKEYVLDNSILTADCKKASG